MKHLIKLTAAAALLFAGSASADILDLDGESCGNGGVTVADVSGATACWGAFNGNDQNEYDGYETGGTVYTSYAKYDADDGLSGADVNLDVSPFDENGDWSFDGFGGEDYLIVLKAADAPGFAIFLMPGSITSGTYHVAWGHDLSHFAIYRCSRELGDGDCTTEVPEPGTLALLGLGLLGIGAARRRKLA